MVTSRSKVGSIITREGSALKTGFHKQSELNSLFEQLSETDGAREAYEIAKEDCQQPYDARK